VVGMRCGSGGLAKGPRLGLGRLPDCLGQFLRLNSGTPSVRSRISSTTSCGAVAAAERPTGRAGDRSVGSASVGTCFRPAHGASKSGPERHQKQDRQPGTSSIIAIQQLEARRIDPVHVPRRSPGSAGGATAPRPAPQSLQRLCFALLRRKVEPRISSIDAGQESSSGNKRWRHPRGDPYDSRPEACRASTGVVRPFEPRARSSGR